MRAPRVQGHGSTTVFARANTESVWLAEHYGFREEISKNPSQGRDGQPVGKIRVEVPLDGDRYFTRQAVGDVARTGRGPGQDDSALIGHLLLSGFEQTDLGVGAGLNSSFGAIPLRVPLPSGPNGVDLSGLSADRASCVIEHVYQPVSDGVSVKVLVDLLDPDGVDLLNQTQIGPEMRKLFEDHPSADKIAGRVRQLVRQAAKGASGDAQMVVQDITRQITQQVSFRSYLQLRLTVQLILPAAVRAAEPQPLISKVSLHWPTLTSMRALHLETGGGEDSSSVRYNPNTRSIEWTGAAMRPLPDDGDPSTPRTYRSATMVLKIDQPGELYEADSLSGKVEIWIPGVLLSGTRARLYDATGALRRNYDPPTVGSTVSDAFELILDDAFARRVLTPFQHLYFDGVIPDPMRIADVKTELENRGFDVVDTPLESGGPGSPALRHFLMATRSEGPDPLELWIYLEGRHQETERQSRRGETQYTTKLSSGELKMFVRGSLPGSSHALVLEMNSLQQGLRDRFARLRQNR